MKYSWKNIMQMLEDKSRLIDWSAEQERIKRLCAFETVRCSNMKHLQETKEKIDIVEGVGALPDDCYMFLSAESEKGEPIEVIQEADFVKPKFMQRGRITVLYKAIPLDEEFMPVISDTQLEYVLNAVYHTIMYDEYIQGKVPNYVWQEIESKKNAAYSNAIKPQLNRQDINNVVYLLKYGRFYNRNPL